MRFPRHRRRVFRPAQSDSGLLAHQRVDIGQQQGGHQPEPCNCDCTEENRAVRLNVSLLEGSKSSSPEPWGNPHHGGRSLTS